MASSLFKTLINSSKFSLTTRSFSSVSTQISNHTAKWMQVLICRYQKQRPGVESSESDAGLVGHIHLNEVVEFPFESNFCTCMKSATARGQAGTKECKLH